MSDKPRKWTLRHGDFTCYTFLFQTRAAMLRCIVRHHGEQFRNPKGGAFSMVDYEGATAYVYFCEETLLLDYISHEFFHVAYRVAIEEHRTYDHLHEHEETFAEMHSDLFAQFLNKYAGLPKQSGIMLNDKLLAKSCKVVSMEELGT